MFKKQKNNIDITDAVGDLIAFQKRKRGLSRRLKKLIVVIFVFLFLLLAYKLVY